MPNIKTMVVRYLWKITLLMVAAILIAVFVIQILNGQRQAQENADAVFCQIEQILSENQNELMELKEEYSQTCLRNAEAIAYIIQCRPDVLQSVEELKKIAGFMEVDEIHVFDKTGRIFTGTHPEYYNFTFDSGEQMSFFKPMLQDKSLKLCQDITPNTAENKLMQYSACWSENGKFILQVGMEPVNVMKVTEKNELSYIFSLLKANVGADLYAADIESGEIKGATDPDLIGKNLEEIGFDMEDIRESHRGFRTDVNGKSSYCVFTVVDDTLIGRVVSEETLYRNIPATTAGLAVCLILIAVILVAAVTWYMNKFVIDGIYNINEKLRIISSGNLDETVNVQSSFEFSELSSHINEMVKSILASTDKISYVLNKTNMKIGVYEYNAQMKHVRFTEYVPQILSLDPDKGKEFFSNYKQFQKYINRLRENPVPEEEGVFCLKGEHELYVRIDEISRNNDILGVVMDVTEDVMRRRQIESERDRDLLTGLYNRRGLESRISALLEIPSELGHGALIMIDADGLKGINDRYGHEKGDVYLKKISEAITSVNWISSIASRQGGDEFVLFLYHYESERELITSIESLQEIQNNRMVELDDNLSVPLKFSFGYSTLREHKNYQDLLKQADERMYENKYKRKFQS